MPIKNWLVTFIFDLLQNTQTLEKIYIWHYEHYKWRTIYNRNVSLESLLNSIDQFFTQIDYI